MIRQYDVAIVGGGMVGASLAAALAPLGFTIALIESVAHDSGDQPSFDDRTTALSNGSRRILETLGLWSAVGDYATPIKKIHVSDRGAFGFARIDAAEQNIEAIGYVLPNRVLGRELWSRIAKFDQLSVLCPARVGEVAKLSDRVRLEVLAAERDPSTIEAGLVVAADGAQSAMREAFGIGSAVSDYQQTAVITTILPQHFHGHVAYERFTSEGPIAVLPAAQGRCTLVLTLARERAESAMRWSDAEFLAEVQSRFGFRLGRILQVGRRSAYPLSLTRSARTSAARCAVIGNAAQSLHPVAGMGFNLGLRDAACLAELLAQHRREEGDDCGNPRLLAEYDAWRAADRRAVIAFTDGLVRLFANPSIIVRQLRNLGLLAFDLLPPAKSALSSLSTGAMFDARVPKLARGVALS